MKGCWAIPAFVGAVLLAACGETPSAARSASSRSALTSPPELLANEPREILKKMYDELLLSAQADASARVVPEKFVLIQGIRSAPACRSPAWICSRPWIPVRTCSSASAERGLKHRKFASAASETEPKKRRPGRCFVRT